MNKAILVRGARQLLTLRGPGGPRVGEAMNDLGIIQDGAVLIHEGNVVSVGPSRRLENLRAARNATEIDATGRVVMPGFVDSHTHLVCGPPRLGDYEMRLAGSSYEEIAEAGGGILLTMRAVRASSTRKLELQARQWLNAFIRHGTTTLEAKSGYGLDEAGELRILRAITALDRSPLDVVPTYLGAHIVPPEYAGASGDYLKWMCSHMLPLVRKRKLAYFADVFCERGAFTLEQATVYLAKACELGFHLKIHAEQFSHTGGARMAVALDAASADHLECADAGDIAVLAASNTIATLLPGSVFYLGLSRYAPARAMIDAGVAVALSTDFNPGSSPTCNMQIIISLACAQMRMTPAEAITAATINGAHALRCAHRVGTIEVGKQADLLIMDVPDYREIPYHFGVNLVAMVMKRGAILYRQGEIQWDGG